VNNYCLYTLKKFIPIKVKSFLVKKYYGELKKLFKKYYNGYCIAIKKTINKRNEDINLSPLFKEFKNNSIKYNYFDDEWWSLFIFAAKDVAGVESLKSQKVLINVIERVPEKNIDIRDFVHIYNISLKLGLLHVGFHIREKALNSAINRISGNKRIDIKDYFYGVPALYEKNKLSFLSDVFSTNKSHRNESYSILYDILKNKKINAKKVNNYSYDFYSLINGKTIALVGPAKSHHNDAKEIDSHDIVVRCNYKEEGVGLDELIKGVRCNISYYNGNFTRFLLDSNLQKFPEHINWIVTKTDKYNKILKHKFNEKGLDNLYNFRSLHDTNKYFFNGGPNAIPNIIYDLLIYEPTKIKIFHADFMLTVHRNNGYLLDQSPEEFSRKQDFLRTISISHDPISQFRFIKKLYKTGLIEGDKRFEEVISLNAKQFMINLQDIYGEAGHLNKIK